MVNSLFCDKHNRTQGARRKDTILVCRSRARPKPGRAQAGGSVGNLHLGGDDVRAVVTSGQFRAAKTNARSGLAVVKTQKDMMEICMSAQVCLMLATIRTKLLRERRLYHAHRKGDRSPSEEVSLTSARFCCRQHQLSHRRVFICCQSVQSHIDPCTCMAQVTKHIVCASPKNIHTTSSSRNVVHLAEPDTTHGHSFSTFS